MPRKMMVGISRGWWEKQGVLFVELHYKVIGVSVPRLGLHLYVGVAKKNRTFFAFSKLDNKPRAMVVVDLFRIFFLPNCS